MTDTPTYGSPDAPAGATPLTVVGIGASAGGLKALQQFVEAIPADSGMAFVVVVHLDPSRESRMGELLQDRAAIPVTQVSGPTEVEANHIYIIPPGQDLAMRGTTLGLRERGERSEHAPVDLFLRTLAEAYGSDSVGVILSGTGADGTAGIRYVREAGGITAAQLPEESEYDGMPASAISTGLVDLVLPSAAIPAALARLRLPSRLGADGTLTPATEAGLAEVFATLHSRTGHDFSQYKRSTVLRRLERRIRFNDLSGLEEYLPVLKSGDAESRALLRDLLISVSSFFRDPDAFEALGTLLPTLFRNKGSGDSVRVWVVGCASGEEVYSLAMVLAEYAETLDDPPRIQLFATDIDERGYGFGRAGLYPPAAVVDIAPERLQRFFTREAGGFRIAKSLRELVLFAGHNVLHDAPFSRMDLVSCRNLFIYLQPAAQERVLDTFHFALNPDGLLFLGASETAGESGLFAATNAGRHRLYSRVAAPPRSALRLSAADPQPRSSQVPARTGVAADSDAPRPRFSYGALHVRMLEQYAPASVIVDEQLDVVHLSAKAGLFLRLGEGEPSRNLMDLAREDVRRVLRTTLHHAFADGAPATRQLRISLDGVPRQVTVRVRPSEQDGAEGRFALIIFDVDDAVAGSPAVPGQPPEAGAGTAELELEEELNQTRNLLEATSAAHDRTVGELQTVNEELRSINEEQKAAAEELETGREEIQAINEELTTINQEHQSTIEELKRTNADLQNLIESAEVGTVFLDRALRIRRFTPAVDALFNLVAADQGRPLHHITHRLEYAGLMADVEGVLTSGERLEREVRTDGGNWYIVRINPYRSVDGDPDGVVLTFFDHTAQHRVKEQLREAKSAAETANLAKGTFLGTLSHEFRTPLNAILGYADLLQLDGKLDASQAQKVERIKVGGWHLVSMIEEILSFAKLDGGYEVVQPEPMDARWIASEAKALMEPAATRKGLAFVLDVPDERVELFTDVAKSRQVLLNLCGNAVKYTDVGEINLRVRDGGERVTFDVQDTGIGVAPEHRSRIFERFWQVDGGSTRVNGGLGIGLAAAREYARLLGGDIEMDSDPGEGSTFRFWLPTPTVPDPTGAQSAHRQP
ncbi:MAG TPA: chemotaxis protein CheB [Longimicrobiales bacterium]|nr:chemotaxis protein CheB [Longimicrobiales bacterium]